MKKTLPAGELMPEYRAMLDEGLELPLVISGGSMLPFLAPGRDTVYLRKPERPLRRGDIAFYRRANGRYVLHRVCRVTEDGVWCIGDAQSAAEGPFPGSSVFAVVTAARRKGKLQRAGAFWWDFFAGPWLCLIPLRRPVLRLYGRLRAGKH